MSPGWIDVYREWPDASDVPNETDGKPEVRFTLSYDGPLPSGMKRSNRLKLPEDFLGTVQALLNTPPPPKRKRKKARKSKRAK